MNRRLKTNISATNCSNLKTQLRSILQAATRLQRVFWPKRKRLIVIGIVGSDINGSPVICNSPGDVQDALRLYWGDVYARKALDEEKARRLLNYFKRKCGHLFNFTYLESPDQGKLTIAITKTKDSATGPDGVPYSAYKANVELSAQVLRNSLDDLQLEFPQSDLVSFSAQLIGWPLKELAQVMGRCCSELLITFMLFWGVALTLKLSLVQLLMN